MCSIQTFVFLFTFLLSANGQSDYTLIKAGNECKSSDTQLRSSGTLEECHQACISQSGCDFFIFGINSNAGYCFWEKTSSKSCPEGWESDNYDFYEMGSDDIGAYDYCFDEPNLAKYTGTGCSSSNQCNMCEGDCNSDSDCKGSLTCFQREEGQKVAGCQNGGDADLRDWDFCYDEVALTKKGAVGCSATNQCSRCEGDCESDSDCSGSLKCKANVKNLELKYGSAGDKGKGSECTSSQTCSRCQGDCDDDK